MDLNLDEATHYALVRMRYDRDPSFVPKLETRLATLSGNLRLEAVKTLSLLYGQKVQPDGRRLASDLKYLSVDCAAFKATRLRVLSVEDAPALNICLRQGARRENGVIDRIESEGWIETPLKPSLLGLVMREMK